MDENADAKRRIVFESKKYSQKERADSVGVSRRLIVDIEAGRGTSLLVFVKILKTFNKTEKLIEILNTTNISPKEMYKSENK